MVYLADGKTRKNQEIHTAVPRAIGLNDEQMRMTYPLYKKSTVSHPKIISQSIVAASPSAENTTENTPEELIERSVDELEAILRQDILKRLRELFPTALEHLVVNVLLAMGYVGSEGQGVVTQASNDGGIDGVIDQDALGLAKIYVQAKNYNENSSMDRPSVQSFVGAMRDRAAQGVFITSGSFTNGAQEYAKSLSSLSLVLIDGESLAYLMIKYRVGCK